MYMTGRAAVMKTGLNNTSVIVWAISEFFSSFFGILMTYIIVIYKIHNRRGGGNKNGSKQYQMCVWAISEFFFLFFFFF